MKGPELLTMWFGAHLPHHNMIVSGLILDRHNVILTTYVLGFVPRAKKQLAYLRE